ncbi:hypothetical protein EV361DRAFT_870136 [Lentinula raphanica]|nr:hypothetical protein EV361DRAFT_870136 [Lentinula raphanica]
MIIEVSLPKNLNSGMARFALQLAAITFIGIATIEIVYLPTLAAPISAFSEPPVPSSDSLLGQGSQTIGGTQRLALEAVELGVPINFSTRDLYDKEPNPVDDDDLFTFELDGVDNRACIARRLDLSQTLYSVYESLSFSRSF